MTALLLSALVVATGILRPVDVELTSLAQVRVAELTAAGELAHRALPELDNGTWDGWGEVLAWSSFDDPVAGIVDGWMDSPEHHAILVDADFEAIGCATAWSGVRLYAVCILGDRAGSAPEPPEPPAPGTVDHPIQPLSDTATAVAP